MAAAVLDTVHTVETPEGVRLVLRTAGPVPRALAFFLDLFLRVSFYTVASIAIGFTLPDFFAPLLVIVIFGGEWFYPVLFEVLNQGQTLGKKLVGLRVVNEDGTRVGWSTSLLRNLLLSADLLPGTYMAGLISTLASPSFQRLGDLAAGTLVIHVERPSPELPALEAAPIAPPFSLTLEEQRAVIDFAERAALFSDARADELAALATPLLGAPGSPRQRLVGMGAWLRGRTHGSHP